MNSAFSSKAELDRVLAERAPEIADDPRVAPTIRIGGIGHRRIGPQAAQKIAATVGRCLQEIRFAGEEALRRPRALTEFTGPLDVFVITPLAEGADRLIAHAALANQCQLGAVIPLALADYEATFDLAPSGGSGQDEFRNLLARATLPKGYGILVLDGPSEDESDKVQSYRDGARTVARWSDILIAVLRADRANSETGLSVRDAVERGMPVILIDPQTPDQFSLSINGSVLSKEAEARSALKLWVARLLGASLTPNGNRTPERAFQAYRAEDVACDTSLPCDFESGGPYTIGSAAPWWISWFWGANRLLAEGMGRDAGGNSAASQARVPVQAWDMPFDRAAAAPFVELYLRHHRADVVASYFAELHRSAQLLAAILGIIVATIAITDAITRPAANFATLVELACLLYAVLIVAVAYRQRWLERWIDYRLIAEVLRHAKYLLVCGHPVSFAGFGQYATVTSAEHNWIYEHCRHVLRSQRIAMPRRSEDTSAEVLNFLTRYLVDQCIDGQIAYHRRTARLRNAAGRVLHNLTVAVVAVTVVAVAAKLFFLTPALYVASVLLPIVAGALLAMRAYGEHAVVARRSSVVVSALLQRKERMEKSRTIAELERHMAMAAETLLRDVDGWLELFTDKHIEM